MNLAEVIIALMNEDIVENEEVLKALDRKSVV